MSVKIDDVTISKVCVIDDDEISRDAMQLTIEDTMLVPISQSDSVFDLEAYLSEIRSKVDAIVSDHHLRKRTNYFPVNGADFVYRCYDQKIPSILVTRYEQADIDEIRKFRNKIPTILTPDEFTPESLLTGLKTCIKEFNGFLSPSRKAWRTLVRVDDVSTNSNFFVVIPAWNKNEMISLNRHDLPEALRNMIKPDMRFHADVNIGAEHANELYFTNWEQK